MYVHLQHENKISSRHNTLQNKTRWLTRLFAGHRDGELERVGLPLQYDVDLSAERHMLRVLDDPGQQLQPAR